VKQAGFGNGIAVSVPICPYRVDEHLRASGDQFGRRVEMCLAVVRSKGDDDKVEGAMAL
jgi:hypothetical protein